ncbi:D-glycerate dehydrogenase [Chromatiales bacterium (ex Bugula neritina AB1)]|nr:D-glycerate dehydrogenase [Chromatiales bacterium (ex Bugula neritina AB1)]
MKPSVLVTRKWPTSVEKKLAELFDVTLNSVDEPLSQAQMRNALFDHDAILTTVTDKLDASVFDGIKPSEVKTRIIGNYGVGFSHIDLASAKRLGIVVTNTPDVLSECTADIAVMLMLMAARRAGEGERELRNGEWTGWRPTHMIGHKVSQKTFGIVGFGRIGKAAAQRARGFDMDIKVYNRSRIAQAVLDEYGATQLDSLDDLFSQSDFVSLHCPGGAENTHLVNQRLLGLMKSSGFLINTARGEVVDDEALISVLKNNQIAGAGLDVFNNEPLINKAYLALDNVVLLPHLGSATETTRDSMGYRVIDNISAFFRELPPPDLVSLTK